MLRSLVESRGFQAAIVAVLMLVFYVSAVLATKLFGEDFPE